MWVYYNNNELYHHGVKGMKWGVRRYQNKDGTLTSAGKKRQARIEKKESIARGKLAKEEYRAKTTESYNEFERKYEQLRQKHLGELSKNTPLNRRNEFDDEMLEWETKTYDRMYKRWESNNTKLKILGETKAKDLEAYENHQAKKVGIGAIAVTALFTAGFGTFVASEFKKAPNPFAKK